MSRLLVIGVGNDLRGDDAAGLLAARRLAERGLPDVDVEESAGDAVSLAVSLARHERAVVIDALDSAGPPGLIVELSPAELARSRRGSSHGLGLVEAIALARALGRGPDVRVVGIAGTRFGIGEAPSPEVVAAAARVAGQLEEELPCA